MVFSTNRIFPNHPRDYLLGEIVTSPFFADPSWMLNGQLITHHKSDVIVSCNSQMAASVSWFIFFFISRLAYWALMPHVGIVPSPLIGLRIHKSA